MPCINTIIPQTNSLAKLDKFLNDIPDLKDFTKPLKIRVTSQTLVRQVLAGTIIAKLANNPKYDLLVNRYLAYAEKYPPDKIPEIDLLRKFVGIKA